MERGDDGRNLTNLPAEIVPNLCGENAKNAASVESAPTDYGAVPDGGTRAWLVMLGAFFCNGILFGLINTYSLIYTEVHENLRAQNVTDASGKAALVGSLAMGSTFLVSAVAGMLTDAIGIRTTTFIGGAIATLGMFLSSYCVNNIAALYFTYGIMFGAGCALTYTPSLAILGHYFRRRLGIVNGIVTAGSSVFTFTLPFVIDACLRLVRLEWTLRFMALLISGIMASSFLYKPSQAQKQQRRASSLANAHRNNSDKTATTSAWKRTFNARLFQNRAYLMWAVIVPLSLCGYFVPYVHMMTFVVENYPGHDGKVPVMCIGLSSGVGRLIFGYLADKPRVNRIALQQLAFLVIGVFSALLPFTAGHFELMIAAIFFMGIFDGCFVALIGPVAFDLCGQRAASQGIGFLLCLCSVPLTVGPYVAGIMYDQSHSYDAAFRLAGLPPIVGALAMFMIHWQQKVERRNGLHRVSNASEDLVLQKSRSSEYAADKMLCAENEYILRCIDSSLMSSERNERAAEEKTLL